MQISAVVDVERESTFVLLRYLTNLVFIAMKKRTKVADLSDFDASRYLNSEVEIAAYLTDILAANDTALLVSGLGDIVLARGLSELAKSAGISRESLYEALSPGSAPCFDTINRVCMTLGVRLEAFPQGQN